MDKTSFVSLLIIFCILHINISKSIQTKHFESNLSSLKNSKELIENNADEVLLNNVLPYVLKHKNPKEKDSHVTDTQDQEDFNYMLLSSTVHKENNDEENDTTQEQPTDTSTILKSTDLWQRFGHHYDDGNAAADVFPLYIKGCTGNSHCGEIASLSSTANILILVLNMGLLTYILFSVIGALGKILSLLNLKQVTFRGVTATQRCLDFMHHLNRHLS